MNLHSKLLPKNTIIEQQFNANKVKRIFGSTTTSKESHPYQNGMFISFSNYRTYQEKLIKNYKRQYQSLLNSCGIKISRDDISIRYQLPTRRTITDLIVNKIPILVAACHDNERPDDCGKVYHHNHFLLYNIHHYLPKNNLGLRKMINSIITKQGRYIGGKVRSNSIKIDPVGGLKHPHDSIPPSEFYEWLQTPKTDPEREGLMRYLSKSNKKDSTIRYPFHYLFYNKNILPPAG
jgi:hypothetical protein